MNLLVIQVIIDPTFILDLFLIDNRFLIDYFAIFVCGPLQSFVVNVCISLLFTTGRAVLPCGWYLCVQDFHNQSQGKKWYLDCVSLSFQIFRFLPPVMTQGTI